MSTDAPKELAVSDAREQLADLLMEVAFRGHEVLITRYGRPMARLVPLDQDDPGLRPRRRARRASTREEPAA